VLLPGLHEFLEAAHQNQIPMAIGSAAIPFNIDFVLDNLNIRHYFKAIVSADDVVLSKPHPETYLNVAELLNINPADCLVFEDVPKGAEAALNAGMKSPNNASCNRRSNRRTTTTWRQSAPIRPSTSGIVLC